MIVFKKITYKNFLSVGNKPVEIELDTAKATIISGKNGNGKSSVPEAIFFALYGKSFRKVNKDSLINAINKKNLLVTLELNVNGAEYKVERGIKPGIFKIYVNGTLKAPPASIKDYQKWLVDDVLHMNEKTFREVIIIGSTSFVPFMRLSAAERRVVVEDILKIDIISMMNQIAKTRRSTIEASINNISSNVQSKRSNLESLLNASMTVKSNYEEQLNHIVSIINDYKNKGNDLLKHIKILLEKSNPDELSSLTKQMKLLDNKEKELEKMYTEKVYKIDDIQNNKAFFTNKEQCPYCTQSISKEFLEAKHAELTEVENKVREEEQQISAMINKIRIKRSEMTDRIQELYDIERNVKDELLKLKNINEQIKFYQNEQDMCVMKSKSHNDTYDTQIEELKSVISSLEKQYGEETSKLDSYGTIISLLKDDGIKTVIIRNYLGTINALVKKYLSVIGSSVNFTFDENFAETIKARGRDIFEYNSFSEGERLRIDFCLLFAFRDLAKLRSTVNTNLLIIDEQDGRLDADGIAAVNTLLSSMNGNLFVISQYPEIYDEIATRHIVMSKDNHFTTAEIL